MSDENSTLKVLLAREMAAYKREAKGPSHVAYHVERVNVGADMQ
jgi:hypothetical protein